MDDRYTWLSFSIMICSLPFRLHVANSRQHVAVHSQGFVGAASFVVSDGALAAFCFEAAQTSGPAPDTMSHEALRPQFGMTICSDGTAAVMARRCVAVKRTATRLRCCSS